MSPHKALEYSMVTAMGGLASVVGAPSVAGEASVTDPSLADPSLAVWRGVETPSPAPQAAKRPRHSAVSERRRHAPGTPEPAAGISRSSAFCIPRWCGFRAAMRLERQPAELRS